MRNVGTIKVGGIFLMGGALAFMGVFAYLAAQFNYPEVLDVSSVVDPVAAVNNYLLPFWMIIFGVALIRHPAESPDNLQSTDSLTAS
jgi:hypothetical protein